LSFIVVVEAVPEEEARDGLPKLTVLAPLLISLLDDRLRKRLGI